MDALRARLGESQGRIRPRREPPAVSEHVFVLGDELLGQHAELALGDYAAIQQPVDLTEVDLLRVRARLQVPVSLPVGLAWEVALTLNGVRRAWVRAESGRRRDITDLALNVAGTRAAHLVGVRLTLVEA